MIECGPASIFQPEKYAVTQEEKAEFESAPLLKIADTSHSTHVRLPVRFEGGKPAIRWYDEWRIEDLV